MKKEVELSKRKCEACEGGVAPLSDTEASRYLADLDSAWSIEGKKLVREFLFKNHYDCMAFVNAVAYISHQENHHPYMSFGFKDLRVEYWTHAVDDLTENDFICAAKVDRLLD